MSGAASSRGSLAVFGVAVLASILAMLTAVVSLAQQSTTTSTHTKKFEVIAVDGDHLIVKLPEGTRELTLMTSASISTDSGYPRTS